MREPKLWKGDAMTFDSILRVMAIVLLVTVACAARADATISSPTSTPTLARTIPYVPSPPSASSPPSPWPACTAIAKQIPENFQATGKVVLCGALFDSPSLLWALDSQERIDLPLESGESILFWMFSVSPDRTRLAYGGAKKTERGESVDWKIHFVTADGKEYKVIPMEQDWAIFSWLNDTYLLIERFIPKGKFVSSPLLLDPITEQKQELAVDDPDIMYFDRIQWGFSFLSRTVYSGDLTKVAYPVFGESRPIRVVDRRTGRMVDIPTTDYGQEPSWSPDGRFLAFISNISPIEEGGTHNEIFLIGEDNSLRRLSRLSEKYPDYVSLTSLVWSPDGESIAFWMSTDKSAGYRGLRLAVLEVSTGTTVEYCSVGSFVSVSTLTWSPDGKYLLIGLDNNDKDLRSVVLILDPTSGEVFRLAEDYSPQGWLK